MYVSMSLLGCGGAFPLLLTIPPFIVICWSANADSLITLHTTLLETRWKARKPQVTYFT